jgi:hypothetical protein
MATRWCRPTAALALLAFALFGVLALLPWPTLRHLDGQAPAAGDHLATRSPAIRTPALVITDLGSPLAADIVTVVAAGCFALLRRPPLALPDRRTRRSRTGDCLGSGLVHTVGDGPDAQNWAMDQSPLTVHRGGVTVE